MPELVKCYFFATSQFLYSKDLCNNIDSTLLQLFHVGSMLHRCQSEGTCTQGCLITCEYSHNDARAFMPLMALFLMATIAVIAFNNHSLPANHILSWDWFSVVNWVCGIKALLSRVPFQHQLDVFSSNLANSQSHKIWYLNYHTALEFNKRLCKMGCQITSILEWSQHFNP